MTKTKRWQTAAALPLRKVCQLQQRVVEAEELVSARGLSLWRVQLVTLCRLRLEALLVRSINSVAGLVLSRIDWILLNLGSVQLRPELVVLALR